MGVTYRIAESNGGVASIGAVRSELVMKWIILVVTASILVLFIFHLVSLCGLIGLSTSMAIVIIGDASAKWLLTLLVILAS
ncbi:hypothetical protein Gohar_004266, partial [Gossypium harknessii]|nr:hypothetical protein [Gossypium harknessii]